MIRRLKKDIWENRYPILIVVIYLIVTHLLFGEVCPLKLLVGYPCPGCGLTRGCMAILTLHWRECVLYHPAAVLWVMVIFWFLIKRYVLGARTGIMLWGLTAALTMGVYVWRMATQFPGAEPMTYFEGNLLRYLLTFLTLKQ